MLTYNVKLSKGQVVLQLTSEELQLLQQSVYDLVQQESMMFPSAYNKHLQEVTALHRQGIYFCFWPCEFISRAVFVLGYTDSVHTNELKNYLIDQLMKSVDMKEFSKPHNPVFYQ